MNTLRDLSGYSEPKLFQQHLASRIVLFSIHQPTSDIFHLFTNIILMSAGRIIFHGTVQEAQTLFNNIGLHCPPLYNPAEFYVNRISDRSVADEIVRHEASERHFEMDNSQHQPSKSSDETQRVRTSWLRQVVLLSHRGTLNFLHNPRHYLIELLILIVSFLHDIYANNSNEFFHRSSRSSSLPFSQEYQWSLSHQCKMSKDFLLFLPPKLCSLSYMPFSR